MVFSKCCPGLVSVLQYNKKHKTGSWKQKKDIKICYW